MANDTDGLEWMMIPRDGGQIIEVAYAVDWENSTLYRRSIDRSDNSMAIEKAMIVGGEFAPYNGTLPDVGPWHNTERGEQ